MDFEDILEELVSGVPDALAATLMGMDGIPLACYHTAAGGGDIESLGVEYGKILGEIIEASEVLRLGNLTDVTLNLEDVVVLLRPVTSEYFIALLLSNTAMVGKARFVIKGSIIKARNKIAE